MNETRPIEVAQQLISPRTLIVLRHAKSSWDTGEPDHRRPLAPRGWRDAVVAGQVLAEYQLDVVLCSTAMRARQTWQRAEVGGARCGDVRFLDALYGAYPSEVLQVVQGLPMRTMTAAVIGHEPTLSDFILDLAEPSPASEEISHKFPTCGLAVLRFHGSWAQLGSVAAEVVRFETPRG